MTIQQAIDRIKSKFEGKAGEHTVDTIKSGDPSQSVRSIVVTFMATREVLAQAVAQGANLIITHEPRPSTTTSMRTSGCRRIRPTSRSEIHRPERPRRLALARSSPHPPARHDCHRHGPRARLGKEPGFAPRLPSRAADAEAARTALQGKARHQNRTLCRRSEDDVCQGFASRRCGRRSGRDRRPHGRAPMW